MLLRTLLFSTWSKQQDLRWLALGGQTVKNLRWLAWKFDLNQSERKSTQLHARPGKTEAHMDASWNLASTCVSVWPDYPTLSDEPRRAIIKLSDCVLFSKLLIVSLLFQGKRDVLEEHSKTAVHTHLSLALLRIRENESRSTCTNGVFIWKIANYKQQYEQAVASPEDLAIFSPPFYTSQYGYKMRLKAYLQGRDRGKSTHLSLYIIIMKGDYDALLDWPFKQKITFFLIDQGEQKAHRTHQLSPNRSLPNIKVVFNRPTMKENLGIGNPCFVPHEALESGEFIKDDALFIKAVVEPSKATTWPFDSIPSSFTPTPSPFRKVLPRKP